MEQLKTNNVDFVDSLGADKWNQVASELNNIISGSGITPSSGDLSQLWKSIQSVGDGKVNVDGANINNTDTVFANNLNTKGIRTVVETWSSGANWYRVWSDGWIEQGGQYTPATGGSVFSFPKAFTNTNYTIVGCVNDGVYAFVYFGQLNTSYVKATTMLQSGQGYGQSFRFYACGY